MKAWLISIVGVVVLIAIAEMVLPEGRMRGAVRGVFSVILMLVVLSPLPSIKNAEWTGVQGIESDEITLDGINALKESALENDCEKMLARLGYECAVDIVCEEWKQYPMITSVVIRGVEQHEEISYAVSEFLNVELEVVTYH